MFHKIKSVTPLPEYKLLVHFAEGTAKQYDVAALCEQYEVFRPLQKEPGLFASVQVDAGGYGISWNDDIDLDCDELWNNGSDVMTPFDDLLSFADACAIWQLNESTLRKAVAYKKLVEGVDTLKFGKQWVITRAAMEREYGAMPS